MNEIEKLTQSQGKPDILRETINLVQNSRALDTKNVNNFWADAIEK